MSKTIGQDQKELEQKELKVLRDQLEKDSLKTFDVRDYVFRQVMKDKQQDMFDYDKQIYKDCDNLVVKIEIGKKWANTFNFDYDAAYISNLVYKSIFFPSGKIEQLNKGYEYVIACDGRYFRGDTMNSFTTTLNEYFRRFGDEYLNYLEKNKEGKNKGKWRIPESCPKDLEGTRLGQNWGNVEWKDFLSTPEVYNKEKPLPDYITDFLKNIYTIGNFIPVPLTPKFNTGRSTFCMDYCDLTLLAIYRYYEEENKGNSDSWKNLFSHDGVKHWLNRHGSWNDFVEGNFLQAFVKKKGENYRGYDYGMPEELWEGHFNFTSPYTPKTYEQFEAFFTNAAKWIKCRGEAMAEALCDCKNTNGDGLLL